MTTSNFITAAAAQDDTVNMVTTLNNVGYKKDVTVKMWNIYLDENTPLGAIEGYKMHVGTTAAKARKLYISGFGYLTAPSPSRLTRQTLSLGRRRFTKKANQQ